MKRITLLCAGTIAVLCSFLAHANANNTQLNRINHFFDSADNYTLVLKHSTEFPKLTITTHTVQPGDNYWKIAKAHNVNIDTLIAANPYWTDLIAKSGEEVIIPSRKGVLLYIEDTADISKIAELFGSEPSEIEVQRFPTYFAYMKQFTNNPLPIAVFIPDKKPLADILTDELAEEYLLREKFRSPLGGRLSSHYGMRKHPIFQRNRFHNGLDIAARRGTYVGAARDGVVAATGWMGGYGKAVIIVHDDGFKTLYGHLSVISVRQGARVKTGQLIGRVGSTGYSTGPHLHFTVWQNGRLLNPLKILW